MLGQERAREPQPTPQGCCAGRMFGHGGGLVRPPGWEGPALLQELGGYRGGIWHWGWCERCWQGGGPELRGLGALLRCA